MQIKEISTYDFDLFASHHPLGSFYQSSSYALVMAEYGYDYDCIGYVDGENNILAAALILHKKVGWFAKYGYSPKGFLIDYSDASLLKSFTEDLVKYYRMKGLAFIKLNPEIAIGEINKKEGNYQILYNQNKTIVANLEQFGYIPLKRNLYFESVLPRFNAIMPLRNFSVAKVTKQTRNKINKSMKKGLEIEIGNRDSIDILYEFIKNKNENNVLFYKDFYNVFSKENLIDIILIKINFQQFLIAAKTLYEKEFAINSRLSEILAKNNSTKAVNLKMQSDRNLIAYKESMALANKGALNYEGDVYIAGAIVVKHQDRLSILVSGYDKKFAKYCPNYFLHYKIFDYYKDDYKFVDLNGISGNFTSESPYHGLNRFKEGFNPKIFEFIGEFDLVINTGAYNRLVSSGALTKEFIKKKNQLK